MKTALQELLDWMNSQMFIKPKDLYSKVKELLPKEKEQIENAYNIAWVDLEEDPYCGEISVGEDYYNKTYETNGK